MKNVCIIALVIIMIVGAAGFLLAHYILANKEKGEHILRIIEPLITCVVAAGFFPMINFNADDPVKFGAAFKLMNLVLGFIIFANFGSAMIKIYHGLKLYIYALISFLVTFVSLVLRYFVEYGEASNTYDFTLGNVVFHLLYVTIVATLFAYRKGKEKPEMPQGKENIK